MVQFYHKRLHEGQPAGRAGAQLPGVQLCMTIQEPDGNIRDLGCELFAQSFNRTRTTRTGHDLNSGTVQLDDVYSLKAASDRFRVTFDQYGHHIITMTGTVGDIWGNRYEGGGTYDVWGAQPLDIDPGVLPGTPLAVGDTFNPTMQFYPRVPADVSLTVTLYPDSDPTPAITQPITGRANHYGYFDARNTQYAISNLQSPITLTHPGEYRIDLTATYTDADGTLHMGAMTWRGAVMTPENEADLIAHGRRGLDSLQYISNHWFIASRDLNIPEGAISHTYNPYYSRAMPPFAGPGNGGWTTEGGPILTLTGPDGARRVRQGRPGRHLRHRPAAAGTGAGGDSLPGQHDHDPGRAGVRWQRAAGCV